MSDERVKLLAEALDAHLPRMAFQQYGQFYNDDPDFDVEAYYERVASAMLATPAFARLLELDEERLAEALNATVGTFGWLRADPSDPIREWRANARAVAHEYRRLAAHKEEARP